jgi:hypothetical protein
MLCSCCRLLCRDRCALTHFTLLVQVWRGPVEVTYTMQEDGSSRNVRGSVPSCLHFFAAKGAPPNAMPATVAAHRDVELISFPLKVSPAEWIKSWNGSYGQRWNRLLGVQFVLDRSKAQERGDGSMRHFRSAYLKVCVWGGGLLGGGVVVVVWCGVVVV